MISGRNQGELIDDLFSEPLLNGVEWMCCSCLVFLKLVQPLLKRTRSSAFTMSGGLDVLAMKDDDVTKLLAAGAHLGDPNVDFQMSQYIFKIKSDGVPIINLRKTWEKLLIAARVVAAIENPADVCVLSNKPFGQVRQGNR